MAEAKQKPAGQSAQAKKKVGLIKGRHPSAMKRHRQSLKRRERNQSFLSQVKTTMKKVLAAAAKKDKKEAETTLREAMSVLARAAAKGMVHWKYAARQTSRLSSLVHKI